MTLKRQWLIILILVAIFSVSVNSIVLSTLTDRYFRDYMAESYGEHFDKIIEYSKRVLKNKDFSIEQMAIELETHLTDPISRIKLYDANGKVVIEVGENSFNNYMINNNMMGRMMDHMMGGQYEEVDNAKIYDDDILLGQVNITRYSSIENSIATRMFKSALIFNSLLSIGIVLVFAIVIGIIISRRMSKDLIATSNLAQNIDDENINVEYSKVIEIRVIQQSLGNLKSKLKLKQKSRKKLIDELIHQTRTPLTILRTHLEGFQDGIIDMSDEEIKICENQINNITSIITNMSGMIDAEKENDIINIEDIEINGLLKQIMSGLKVQFDKKDIKLTLLNNQKIRIKTDKYKLSQAIYNILTNSYKFTNPNGNVSILYKEENSNLSITIEDDGKGISKENQKRIFDAYYRGNKDIAGDGIGLYIVKENLNKINGEISVDSQLGEGSKFTITLPIILN